MRWKTVLFDLDGTLFDTSAGIVGSIRYALELFGERAGSDRDLHKFIGPPVVEALQEFYGMSGGRAEQVKNAFRARYREQGVFECAPIDGAEQCLQALSRAGMTLAVATSKPIAFARQILQRFGFFEYFTAVCGAESDAGSGKAEVVSRALRALGLAEGAAGCVMVGDRKYDVAGAAACKIPCIGLDTGFAEEGELERAGALFVAHGYGELTRLLLG